MALQGSNNLKHALPTFSDPAHMKSRREQWNHREDIPCYCSQDLCFLSTWKWWWRELGTAPFPVWVMWNRSEWLGHLPLIGFGYTLRQWVSMLYDGEKAIVKSFHYCVGKYLFLEVFSSLLFTDHQFELDFPQSLTNFIPSKQLTWRMKSAWYSVLYLLNLKSLHQQVILLCQSPPDVLVLGCFRLLLGIDQAPT